MTFLCCPPLSNANCYTAFAELVNADIKYDKKWYKNREAQLIHSTGSDHCFRTFCLRPFPLFKIQQNKTNFTTCEIMGLAEWIIDDTSHVEFPRKHYVTSKKSNFFLHPKT